MKGTMTSGKEWKHIVLFSLPIMIGNFLQQLYNTVDGIVVGNYVSSNALAAVGSCATLSMIFISAAIGLSSGGGVMIAQYYGAKKYDDMRESCSTTLVLMSIIGITFSILGVLFARPLCAGLLGIKNDEILDMATTYFAIYSAGLIFAFFYNTIASILRAIGDSKATLYFLLISAVINVALDLLFVIVFKWDVAGVAIATVLSQVVSMIVSLIYMFKKYPIFRFKLKEFRLYKDKAKTCLRLGIPTTFQQMVVSVGSLMIQRLVNSFEPSLPGIMSAFTVGMRVENYIFVPIFALNIGMVTFTGQNMGAGKIDRITRGWRRIALISVGTVAVLSVAVYLLAAPLASLFGVDGATLDMAVEYTRFLAKFLVIFALYMSATGVLSGAGDVVFTTIGSLTSLIIRVVLAYAIVHLFDGGYAWAWQTIPIGWTCSAIVIMSRYFSGGWKKKGIVKEAPTPLEAE